LFRQQSTEVISGRQTLQLEDTVDTIDRDPYKLLLSRVVPLQEFDQNTQTSAGNEHLQGQGVGVADLLDKEGSGQLDLLDVLLGRVLDQNWDRTDQTQVLLQRKVISNHLCHLKVSRS
jgi:hypothetical protein